ncbi:TetR/AcrR family transcriptional regulator [Actinocorallia aurea]
MTGPTTADPYIAQRPKRADGARNYDAILAAARAAFESHGSEASLEDVAARAGVAIGTLYRHFPTRAVLVEAATRDGLAALVAEADRLSAAPEPLAALQEWMTKAVHHCSVFRGLVGILSASMYDEGTPSHTMCAAMHAGGARLLTRARDTGAVRADFTAEDLFALITAAAWLRETTGPHHDGSSRMLRLALEGITLPAS